MSSENKLKTRQRYRRRDKREEGRQKAREKMMATPGIAIPKDSPGRRTWKPESWNSLILAGLQTKPLFYGASPATRRRADREHAKKKRLRRGGRS